MGISKQLLGILAIGVIVGWGGSRIWGVFKSDGIYIENIAQNEAILPQVTSTETEDLTSGLALTTSQSAPIIPDDQIDAEHNSLSVQQQAVIAMLERSSRELNTRQDGNDVSDLTFNHLAVIDQTVRHYYTVHYAYVAIDTDAFMDVQSKSIKAALCGNAGLRELIQDLGLTYSYTYLSNDQRKMGEFSVSPESCTG